MSKALFGAVLLGSLCIFALTTGVCIAEYPERVINLIVNYPPGGTADLTARALSKAAERDLGKPISVLNKPGASGAIGVSSVAMAPPDGYTIGVLTYGTLTSTPHMNEVSFDPLKSFDFIMGYGKYMYGLSIYASSPLKTLKEVIEYQKKNPGKLKYANGGLATPETFAMCLLSKHSGVNFEGVVFKGAPEANTAVIGGHIDLISFSPVPMIQYINDGRLRFLCSFNDTRWDWFPNVPTVTELGYPFSVNSWLGLGVPKGVPGPVLGKIKNAFRKAIHDNEFKKVLQTMYMPVVDMSGEEYAKVIEQGYKDNGKLIMELGLHKSQKKNN